MSYNQDIDPQDNEIDLAKILFSEGFLPRPNECYCGNKLFSIQVDNSNKTSRCSFRCTNNKCRRKYAIRINSFFQKFPQIKMKTIIKILELFLCDEINVEKAKTTLNEKYNISLSLTVLYKIYRAFREVIYKYLLIVYQTEELGFEQEHGIFAVDESLFNHINSNQIWVLGIINTSSKCFRLEATLDRSEQTLKKFIEIYVKGGNSIVSDGWRGYYFLNHEESNYEHITTNHLIGNFGTGLQSWSHIEAL